MTHPFVLTAMVSAVLSDDRVHRYWLVRLWDRGKPILVVCMFNPSTADETTNDPTIRELLFFAKAWGFGGILVINLHSIRSSDPAQVRAAGAASRGDAQDQAWRHALDIADQERTYVLAAWGNLPERADVEAFLEVAKAKDVELVCLGTTLSGAPKHPLARGKHRIPRDQRPEPWSLAA